MLLASLFRSSTRYSSVLVTPVLKVFHWRLGFRRVLRTAWSSYSTKGLPTMDAGANNQPIARRTMHKLPSDAVRVGNQKVVVRR